MAASTGLSPAERSLRAKCAVYTSWAHTENPAERTANGRRAFLDRFFREVDPDGVLDPDERARRAEHAKKAYFAKLAMKSSKARAHRATT